MIKGKRPSTEQSFGSVTGAWRILVNRADFELKPATSQSGFFCAPKGLACFSAQPRFRGECIWGSVSADDRSPLNHGDPS